LKKTAKRYTSTVLLYDRGKKGLISVAVNTLQIPNGLLTETANEGCGIEYAEAHIRLLHICGVDLRREVEYKIHGENARCKKDKGGNDCDRTEIAY
jgi:hypothetical protein